MILNRKKRAGQTHWHLTIQCPGCDKLFDQREDAYRRAAYKFHCVKCVGVLRRGPIPYCRDCGKQVSRGYDRCKKCYGQAKRKPLSFCCDCGTQIGNHSGEVRCLPCHNKRQNKGLSRERTLFNVSPKWAVARTACFERDDYTCHDCGVRGGYLHAHHLKSYRDYPNLRLELSNLQTLCGDCHNVLHGLTKKPDDRQASLAL